MLQYKNRCDTIKTVKERGNLNKKGCKKGKKNMKNIERFYEKDKSITDKLSELKMDLEKYVKEVSVLLDTVQEEWEMVDEEIRKLEESEIIDNEKYDNLCSKTNEYSDNSNYLNDTIDAMEDIIKVLGKYA